jgi:hypothetical protein
MKPTRIVGSVDFAAVERAERICVQAIIVALWISVLTQKLTLPLGIEFPFAVIWGMLVYLLLRRRAYISPIRLMSLLAIFVFAGVSQILVHGTQFSMSAWLIGFGMYLPFVFKAPISNDGYLRILRSFANMGVIAAGIALLQWLAQAAHLGMPNLIPLIPDALYYEGYGYMQPTGWQSSWYKPNGIFFLEASHLSQFIALAIIIEVFFFRRLWRTALMFAALFSALSGTGLLVLLLTAPFLVKVINIRITVAVAVLAPIALFGLTASGALDYFSSRTGEFDTRNTSGYGRFVEPLAILPGIYERGGVSAVIAGIGPGNIYDLPYLSDAFAPNPGPKLLAEYGIFVAAAWLGFLHAAVWRSNTPFVVIWPVMISYNFMQGSLLVPMSVTFVLLLVGLPCLRRRMKSGPLTEGRPDIAGLAANAWVQRPHI